MAKIKQLPDHEAQKIAAGEVVERPANIVKELVENSIDAGATRITVYIEDAGKKLIRIVDNGCGMDTTDAQICFDRHATSKITHVHELETVNTFGFRGEALASIAAVSQITLITKEEQSLEGTQVLIEANNITKIVSIACPTGTDIRINNLFFNIPARKKFLKTTQTEWRAIQLLFNAFCFDYPDIHFSLFSDNKQIFNCPITQTIKNRALQLWENTTHNHLLEISNEEKISINGIISNHQHYRYDRSNIYFFVNKRWVKNHHLSNALLKGYDNILPQGRYPIAAIDISIPLCEVDINIHPRKEEVKFLHPRHVEQALQYAVKKALENNASPSYLQQSRDLHPLNNQFNNQFNFNNNPHNAFMAKISNNTNELKTSSQLTMPTDEPFSLAPFDKFIINEQKPAISPLAVNLSNDTNTTDNINITIYREPYHIIGQYRSTYLLVEKETGLFLVDQHAAHERILYELFSERFSDVATIQLLFPQIITLSQQDIETVIPHLDVFNNNGILIEQCAYDQLIIQSLPVHLKEQSLNDIIKAVIGWIIEYQSTNSSELKKIINNKLQAQMACKAAVKAGDTLTPEKMEQLLTDLEKTTNRLSCPHGRPTGWLISIDDIEKKFKRRL